jgi:hypothetical protein
MKTKLAFIITGLLAVTSLTAAASKPPAKAYPLKTCIVTDNALGSMGDERRFVHNGQEIKVCCKPCIAKFKKDPDKYLKKLR